MRLAPLAATLFLAICLCAPVVPASARDAAPTAVTIACDQAFAPYTLLDESGEPQGFLVDFWRLWSDHTGIPVAFRFSDWDGTIEAVRSGEADFHSGLFINAQRDQWMAFSAPFHQSTIGLYYLKGQGPYASLAEMTGLRVGASMGSEAAHYIETTYPDVALALFDTSGHMVLAAMDNRIDAVADETLGIEQAIVAEGLEGEFDHLQGGLYAKDFVAAALKGDLELIATINAGLALITPEELEALKRKWGMP